MKKRMCHLQGGGIGTLICNGIQGNDKDIDKKNCDDCAVGDIYRKFKCEKASPKNRIAHHTLNGGPTILKDDGIFCSREKKVIGYSDGHCIQRCFYRKFIGIEKIVKIILNVFIKMFKWLYKNIWTIVLTVAGGLVIYYLCYVVKIFH